MYKKKTYSIINTINHYSKFKLNSIKLNYVISNKYITDFNLRNKLLYKELPIRLARRINDLQLLPYNFLKNDSMSYIFDQYINSFDMLYNYDLKENDINYINLLEQIIINHKNIEEKMAYSIHEFKNKNNIISSELANINKIINNFYISRLGINFLVKQHLKLYKNDSHNIKNCNNNFGIINNNCNIYNNLKKTINQIKLTLDYHNLNNNIIYNIDCNKDLTTCYIDSHIQYILFEILKNSVIANINFNKNKINIKIDKQENEIIIKISDFGGGISRKNLNKIYDFTYTTHKLCKNKIPINGFGHGLGMSRIYCRFFGGDLILIPFKNYGCDTYIYLKDMKNNDINIV